jgi:diadenosine tetraphosphate (Ap4A) HIT family hydrolase
LDTCPLCSILADRVWIDTAHAVAILAAVPATTGHTVVVPLQHVSTIHESPIAQQAAIWELVSKVRTRLLAELKPDGFTIGLGDALLPEQTVDHALIHVIPRRNGDSPEMPVGIHWLTDGNALPPADRRPD